MLDEVCVLLRLVPVYEGCVSCLEGVRSGEWRGSERANLHERDCDVPLPQGGDLGSVLFSASLFVRLS